MATKNAINSANPIEVAKGGTGVASTTAYGVVCGGTTTTAPLQNAGIATSCKLLLGQGSSALPIWGYNSSGLILIETKTATGTPSELVFNTCISTDFSDFLVLITNYVPATNATDLLLQLSTDGGSSWVATNYFSGLTVMAYNSTTINNDSVGTAFMLMSNCSSTASNGTAAGVVYLSNINTNTDDPRMQCQANVFNTTVSTVSDQFGGGNNSIEQIANALRFFPSSGNITSGTISLYGFLREF